MAFQIKSLAIPAVKLIQPDVYRDDRGYFLESYKESVYRQSGINEQFVQENISFSVANVVRGLHYQKNPAAQAKLIKVFQGEIFDVAVDLRRDSATFGQWVAARLSDQNHQLIYIPTGFAHGFCVLSSTALISYKVTAQYSPENDRGIFWNDPQLKITWPLDISKAIVSAKDAKQPLLQTADLD